MALDPRTPVLVGVGQVNARPDPDLPIAERAEPVDLMARALLSAAADCGPGGAGDRLLARADSIRIVRPVGWRYLNPGALVAERLGITPAEEMLTATGGNSPQALVNQTALALAAGELGVALVAGADCIYTRVAARRDPDRPVLPWTTQPAGTAEPVPTGTERNPTTEVEEERGLDRPSTVYPLFENALRAAVGRSIGEHQVRISELWSRFSEVAATNPHAWTTEARTAEEIRTVSPANRMVAFPYPKLLNANDRVDQGAALILCTV